MSEPNLREEIIKKLEEQILHTIFDEYDADHSISTDEIYSALVNVTCRLAIQGNCTKEQILEHVTNCYDFRFQFLKNKDVK